MAKLSFLINGHSLGEYKLDRERFTIGRRPNCDIQIDNLAVSGEHAAVITQGGSSYVEDLGSTNGTIVNKQTIKKHQLINKDVIEFGLYKLHYYDERHVDETNIQGFAKTVLLKQSTKQTDASATNLRQEKSDSIKPAPTPFKPKLIGQDEIAFETLATGRLKVLNGTSAGRELTLEKAMVRLGKAGAQVAVIIKRPKGYFISHIEGKSHPLINGISIGLQTHGLQNLDVVELAGTQMEFTIDDQQKIDRPA